MTYLILSNYYVLGRVIVRKYFVVAYSLGNEIEIVEIV